uniref:Uncharacterized protein n=1 Tax=Zea mays TaxID=4577 RepID=A0A804NFY6_MAIZE
MCIFYRKVSHTPRARIQSSQAADTKLSYTHDQVHCGRAQNHAPVPVPVAPASALSSRPSLLAPKVLWSTPRPAASSTLSCTFSIWMAPWSSRDRRSVRVRFSPPPTDSYVVGVVWPTGCAPCAPDIVRARWYVVFALPRRLARLGVSFPSAISLALQCRDGKQVVCVYIQLSCVVASWVPPRA